MVQSRHGKAPGVNLRKNVELETGAVIPNVPGAAIGEQADGMHGLCAVHFDFFLLAWAKNCSCARLVRNKNSSHVTRSTF